MALDNKDLSRFLEVAVVSARLAGQHALEQINYAKAVQKSTTELVTDADTRCQQIIVDTIMQNFPAHGIVAEEGKAGAIFKQPPRGDNDIWWVIDPIDGTNNFAQRVMNFAVSIGIIHQGKPVLGVIFEPSTDSMFTAAGDAPPQYNGSKIKASDNDITIFESIGIESVFVNGPPPWITYLMKTLRCRSLGTTAMHLAYVAKGSFIAAAVQRPKLWDITAGTFLVESAGGIITDWKGGPIWPVDMQTYTGQTIETLVANKKVHKKLLEIIAAE
ncbi:MAG: inositol monophosphatase [Planctomycetes bacterium]|nr:inositol monophosphatase [Planctomycetota bacterium]MBU1518130.1 inositol monophosphatase [Planctomycetota bacterium]MBU2457324.1 inositol monophosphatase [Planctomycetota bacterium]